MPKLAIKMGQLARLLEAMRHGLTRVAIDCTLEEAMTDFELKELAAHMKMVYAANTRAPKPFHLHLTGLQPGGRLHQSFKTHIPGFKDFVVTMSEEPHHQIFSADELVYLSPDSTHVLETLEQTKVYVIGGLVDKSIKKGLTENRAHELGLCTARLPVLEYMNRLSNPGHLNLSINQVVDILLSVHNSETWAQALVRHIPSRKNYTLRREHLGESQASR